MAGYSSMFKRLNSKSFRLINPLLHSYLDYAAIVLFLLLPFIMKLSTESVIFSATWALFHLAISIFADFPGGLIKSLSFSAHGWLEFAGGVALMCLPWFTE